MTAKVDAPFKLNEVRALLVKGSVLGSGISPTLVEYKAAFSRRPESRRWHYCVEHEQKNLCHLIVGTQLAIVYERAKEFAAACPDLICRPLFFQEREDGLGFLGLEHFEGESLDYLVEQGRCDAASWLDHVRRAQAILARTKQASAPEKLLREVEELIKVACSYPGLTDFDVQLLRGPAQQAILAAVLPSRLFTQWSNGDFAGRNLLIDPQGDLRLIDYEYAGLTHFGDADWLRLAEFSATPPDLDGSSIPEIKSARQPGLEVQFWLHHLGQLKTAEPSPTLTQHCTEAIGRLFRAVGEAISHDLPAKNDSLLIKLLSQHLLEKKSLVEERTVWAKSLETELDSTRQNFAKISGEYSKRSVWATSLETELRTVQDHFEKLNKEFEERTAWALAMESELKTLHASHHDHLSKVGNTSTSFARLIPTNPGNDAVVVLEEGLIALANLQRDLAIKRSETDRISASLLHATLNLEAANGEVARLTSALNDAQIHLNGLLGHATTQQLQINFLEAAKQEAESKLAQSEQQLQRLNTPLQTGKTEISPSSQ